MGDDAAGCVVGEAHAAGEADFVVAAEAEALLVEGGEQLAAGRVAADWARFADYTGNEAGVLHVQLRLGGVCVRSCVCIQRITLFLERVGEGGFGGWWCVRLRV